MSPPILVDYRRGGRTVKGLVNFARNGYLYFLERSAGAINFVEGMPYVKQNVFKGLDPKTGRPDIDDGRKPDIGKVADFCPSWHGAKNWQPGAYNPKTRMIYAPTQENICAVMIGRTIQTAGRPDACGVDSAHVYRAGRRPPQRSAGVERRHRQEGRGATTSRSRRTGDR